MSVKQLVSDALDAFADQEPTFHIKLVVPALIGNTCRESGETVKVGEVQARALIKNGAAVGSLLSPTTLLMEGPPKVKPQPAAVPDANPNAKVTSGSFFQGNRNFGPGETLRFHGDLIMRLALQNPEKDSAMAEHVRTTCVRQMAIIEPIGRLGTEDEKRLARLRKDPVEPSKEKMDAAKRLYELAAAL